MRFLSVHILIPSLCLLLILSGCNLPSGTDTPGPVNVQQTAAAETIAALETAAFRSPTPGIGEPTATLQAGVSETSTSQAAATPQDPLVVKDALCWEGPGPLYEVVSAVRIGTRVELLGRGSTGSWWIIDNPIYHDPCWVQADVLEFDPGYNLSGLKIYNPPPTPTFTPTPKPTDTLTPTP